MVYSEAASIIKRGDALFSKKRTLDARNQEIADHFYPERADFTVVRDLGADWAAHLMTGYPSMVRRDLGNALGSMLRPPQKHWFRMRAEREERETHEVRAWLEEKTQVMRRAMYDRKTNFTRATKEGDHDFAAFGSPVLSCEVNRRDNTLLYRSWHPRDCAWAEDAFGQIGENHRNWKPTIQQAVQIFGERAAPRLREKLEKHPHKEVKHRHVMLPASEFTDKARHPWISFHIDCEHEHIIEEVPSWSFKYVIPRWATISGSQYAYSPATLIALPDARLLQAMTLTLLDAGERTANPPMVGVAEAVRGDLNLYPGGFTAVDREYDERLGEVLRPLTIDSRGLPFGVEMADRSAAMLKEAFYLNAIGLPPRSGPEMTAFEVGQRVQEYIRQAMPLFEPMEHEYNGALCEITFETLFREGAFGSIDEVPARLRGEEIRWAFESPLSEAIEREKGQTFLEAQAMISAAAEAMPGAIHEIDFVTTIRDVLSGIGVPAAWMRAPQDAQAMRDRDAQQAALAQGLGGAQAGANVAATLGQAAERFAGVEAA